MALDKIYYEINLDGDKTGLKFNSLVGVPAIEVDYQLFSKIKSTHFDKDNAQRLITGPSMIPDKEIKRKFTSKPGYYNCVFRKESVVNTVKKAAKEGNFNNISLNHWQKLDGIDTSKAVEGVFLIESFILNDRTRTELYSDLPDGTWMTTYWVEDEAYWNDVIVPGFEDGTFKGFSVEIVVDMKTEDEIYDDMLAKAEEIIDNVELSKEDKEEQIANLFGIEL